MFYVFLLLVRFFYEDGFLFIGKFMRKKKGMWCCCGESKLGIYEVM